MQRRRSAPPTQEERRLRTEDNPAAALSEVASAVAFMIHPYRRPVVGWMEDIQNLTRQDLVDFYKLYYEPNNAFIVVSGDFSSDDILAKIRAAFGKIPRGAEPPKVLTQEPEQRGERRVIFKKEAELPFTLLFYHTPNLKSPDSFALDLLSVVLADGVGARTIRTHALYHLIFANILLGPLKRIATPLRRLAAPGGRVVLSGILPSQANAVIAAYRLLVLQRRLDIDGWTTLVLVRTHRR